MKIKIGRANDSDIRISDISVSRFHSKLIIVNKILFYDYFLINFDKKNENEILI